MATLEFMPPLNAHLIEHGLFKRGAAILASSTETLDAPELDEIIDEQLTSRVILFNDEWHTFEEVIEQIIKATGCSFAKAEALTMQVHNNGKAMVFEGQFEECLRVSNILEEIELRTQIEC